MGSNCFSGEFDSSLEHCWRVVHTAAAWTAFRLTKKMLNYQRVMFWFLARTHWRVLKVLGSGKVDPLKTATGHLLNHADKRPNRARTSSVFLGAMDVPQAIWPARSVVHKVGVQQKTIYKSLIQLYRFTTQLPDLWVSSWWFPIPSLVTMTIIIRTTCGGALEGISSESLRRRARLLAENGMVRHRNSWLTN